jgi:hypothetical protein
LNLKKKKKKINCYNLWRYFICFIFFNIKIGGILNVVVITAVINNKNVNNNEKEKEKQGKMNIIRNQKRVPHTIMNIPITKDGVHFGVCIIFFFYIFIFYN